jgi:glycosyltransferase involved in cell wall biosynthesis
MDLRWQPLVSVLTPVYNGERYLAECIESILEQTYKNWEYVIVNNHSTDRTLEIAQKYAQKDARIRVHNNKQFVSMMENHNIAARQISSRSKYCKIVHADDWLFPECLTQMVKIAELHPSVSIVGAYGLNGDRVVWDGLPYPSPVVSGREICRRTLLGGFYVFGSPTSLLFRSDLMRGRGEFFNTNEFHVQYSDQEACYEVLQNSDFGFVHQVLTYTRKHDGSMTSLFARTGLNTDLPAHLNILTKYGPVYLTGEEYDKRVKQLTERYYRFLGHHLFRWKNRQFWHYHKRALRYVGYPLSVARLLKASALEIVDALLSPKPVVAKLLSGLRGSAG